MRARMMLGGLAYLVVVAYFWLEDKARALYWRLADELVWDQCCRCGAAFPASRHALNGLGLCPDCAVEREARLRIGSQRGAWYVQEEAR